MSMLIPSRLPNGSRAWLDLEVQDFIQRLTELDDRLALVRNRDKSWSIYRVGEDGSEHLIARSKPYASLDMSIIERLRMGDVTRTNVVEKMLEHNEKVRQQHAQEAVEALMEATDKVLSKAWRGRIPTNVEDLSV